MDNSVKLLKESIEQAQKGNAGLIAISINTAKRFIKDYSAEVYREVCPGMIIISVEKAKEIIKYLDDEA